MIAGWRAAGGPGAPSDGAGVRPRVRMDCALPFGHIIRCVSSLESGGARKGRDGSRDGVAAANGKTEPHAETQRQGETQSTAKKHGAGIGEAI